MQVFDLDGVPGLFGKGVRCVGDVRFVEDGGEGGGYDNSFDGGCGSLDGFEDAGCADERWVNQLLLGVGCQLMLVSAMDLLNASLLGPGKRTPFEMKGTGRVHHHLKARCLDDFVKCIFLCNVANRHNLQLTSFILVRVANGLRLFFRPHCRDDCVTFAEQLVQDVG